MANRGVHPVLGNRRVLIVEDRYIVAEELTRICERHGAAISGPVPDVARARALAKSEPLDLAILDIDLRGKDVFGVAAVLRDRRIPFLFVTGYGTAHLPDAYRDSVLVSKPFSESDLIERIERLLDGTAFEDGTRG